MDARRKSVNENISNVNNNNSESLDVRLSRVKKTDEKLKIIETEFKTYGASIELLEALEGIVIDSPKKRDNLDFLYTRILKSYTNDRVNYSRAIFTAIPEEEWSMLDWNTNKVQAYINKNKVHPYPHFSKTTLDLNSYSQSIVLDILNGRATRKIRALKSEANELQTILSHLEKTINEEITDRKKETILTQLKSTEKKLKTITEEISSLQSKALTEASIKIERWVNLLERSFRKHDYHTAMSIASALNNQQVQRLRGTNDIHLSSSARDILNHAMIALSSIDKFYFLRYLSDKHREDAIPYIGTTKTDLTFAAEMPNKSDVLEEQQKITNSIVDRQKMVSSHNRVYEPRWEMLEQQVLREIQGLINEADIDITMNKSAKEKLLTFKNGSSINSLAELKSGIEYNPELSHPVDDVLDEMGYRLSTEVLPAQTRLENDSKLKKNVKNAYKLAAEIFSHMRGLHREVDVDLKKLASNQELIGIYSNIRKIETEALPEGKKAQATKQNPREVPIVNEIAIDKKIKYLNDTITEQKKRGSTMDSEDIKQLETLKNKFESLQTALLEMKEPLTPKISRKERPKVMSKTHSEYRIPSPRALTTESKTRNRSADNALEGSMSKEDAAALVGGMFGIESKKERKRSSSKYPDGRRSRSSSKSDKKEKDGEHRPKLTKSTSAEHKERRRSTSKPAEPVDVIFETDLNNNTNTKTEEPTGNAGEQKKRSKHYSKSHSAFFQSSSKSSSKHSSLDGQEEQKKEGPKKEEPKRFSFSGSQSPKDDDKEPERTKLHRKRSEKELRNHRKASVSNLRRQASLEREEDKTPSTETPKRRPSK